MDQAFVAAEFVRLLGSHGLREALSYLNGTTDQRFTAIYRFSGDTLSNVGVYDRLDGRLTVVPDSDVSGSFCRFIQETGDGFNMPDSFADARATGHPLRETVRSYCGIPLINREGVVQGSLCHFSPEPRLIYDDDFEVLLQIPVALAKVGIDPGSLVTWPPSDPP